jgi:hypothetical protein
VVNGPDATGTDEWSSDPSWSAENNNIEFGVLIDNPNLAESLIANCCRQKGLSTTGRRSFLRWSGLIV